ncbi:hypothetical protein WMY93_005384 [Mugilogobius chulae]|uniref:Glutamate [NMDA] receptor epsilon subunit C-terminal domain-containing protein n=1 Tax=Mugilogobius chulae TaxID=88201 RepID=A0AAW0PSE1_9GOBI
MDAPILQLSASLLHHSQSAEADLHSLKDKKYSTYNTHSSVKDKSGGSFDGGTTGTQGVRPGHCRSCLAKISGYSGLYTVRSPQARCDACAHLGNLYDISEDHLHSHYSHQAHPGDMFTHYLPQTELGMVGEAAAAEPAALLRELLPDGIPERQGHLRGLGVSDRDGLGLDEGAYANVLTMRSDRPYSSRSPPLLTLSPPQPRRTHAPAPALQKPFPDRPSQNPFTQSAPGTAQREPATQPVTRLPQRSSAHELYKQRMPLSLTLGNHGTHHVNQLGGLDQQMFYPAQEPPVVAYMVPPAASQPMSYVTAPRASSAGGNRPRLYRRMPSIESDV